MFCTHLLPEMVYPNNLGHNFGYYFSFIQLVHRQEIKKKKILNTIYAQSIETMFCLPS